MALRLRRGTDAERQTITPLEGELIYTTDTKKLYVGDGSTAGGLAADTDTITDNFADLTDVDLTGLTDGQTIAYNLGNTRFEPANLPTSINDLSDVDTTDVTAGKVLKWNGSIFVAEVEGAITEGATYNISIDGDVSGSVFSDDSTLIVDGITGNVSANALSIGNGGVIVSENINILDISSSTNNSKIETVLVKSNVVNVVSDLETSEGASFATSTSRGTIAEPVGLQAGDAAGGISFSAYKTSLSDYRVNVGILSSIDTVTGTDDIPSKLSVALRDPDGNLFYALSVNSRGITEAPIFKPTAYATTAARDAAITSPEAGMVIFVTDSDGGGTEALQVYKATGGWTTIA